MPFLLTLRQQTMNGHLIASGVRISDDHHMARLSHRFECAEILLHDGALVGLLKVSRDDLHWTIIQIQLAPGYQGSGSGAGLLGEVLVDVTRAQAVLKLSVLKANPAKSLYERFGFFVERETEFSYEMRREP